MTGVGLTAVSCNKTAFILLRGSEYLILLGSSETENEVKPGSDESEEAKEISADRRCRVCACKSDDLVPVFGEKGVGMQLLDKIHTHLPIMVKYKLMTSNVSQYFYTLDKSVYEFSTFYCHECCKSRVRAAILKEFSNFMQPRGPPSFIFTGQMWSGHEGDHLPLSAAKVKNAWNYTSTPLVFLF